MVCALVHFFDRCPPTPLANRPRFPKLDLLLCWLPARPGAPGSVLPGLVVARPPAPGGGAASSGASGSALSRPTSSMDVLVGPPPAAATAAAAGR